MFYIALIIGSYTSDPAVYGAYGVLESPGSLFQRIRPRKRAIVEITINNNDSGRYSFHLHDHKFQVILPK